jgi:prepilin-type processing-associated H-X9-DG protein
MGYDWDTIRCVPWPTTPPGSWPDATYQPMQDTNNVYENGSWAFGSAHAAGFNVALCDGSVHLLNYSIDPRTMGQLGVADDGIPIDMSQLRW